jgi:hypothetical protein
LEAFIENADISQIQAAEAQSAAALLEELAALQSAKPPGERHF